MGTANTCDKDLLQPGAACIIMVDEANSPTGVWWGKVVEVDVRKTYLWIKAEITGGRFQLIQNSLEAIQSTENNGLVPSINYRVYPDTTTTRHLLHLLQLAREATRQEASERQNQVGFWRTMHLETMAHLLREGLIKPDIMNARCD